MTTEKKVKKTTSNKIKPSSKRGIVGAPKDKTRPHSIVVSDSSTGHMHKLPSEVELRRRSIKVTQLGSCIGRKYDQEQTMIGLGLNKRHKSVVLEDTPSIRGMIRKVRHLLKIEDSK